MGYPVAYRAASRAYRGAEAFNRGRSTQPGQQKAPANDNTPPPANDNAPAAFDPAGTALSPGVQDMLVAASAALPGAAGIVAPIALQFGLPAFVGYLRGLFSAIFLPPNWAEHCPGNALNPGGHPTGVINSGWINPTLHRGGCFGAATLSSTVGVGWTTATWTHEHANFFGFRFHGQNHYIQLSAGPVPIRQPIINPFSIPREQLEPLVHPRVHPAARPIAKPLPALYPPPYRDRPLLARLNNRVGWRDVGPVRRRLEETVPEAPPVRPGRGTKEAKGSNRAFQRLLRAAGGVTEMHDAMECLAGTLPKSKRRKVLGRRIHGTTYMPWGDFKGRDGKWHRGTAYTRNLYRSGAGAPVNQTFQQLAREIYNGWSDLDWDAFQTCFLWNEVEDRLIGGASQATTKNFKPFAPDSGANRGYEVSRMAL